MPRSKRPTNPQERILRIIGEHIAEHGTPPTIREIARVYGSSSPNAIAGAVVALKRKGLIESGDEGGERRRARVIMPTGLPLALAKTVREHIDSLIDGIDDDGELAMPGDDGQLNIDQAELERRREKFHRAGGKFGG